MKTPEEKAIDLVDKFSKVKEIGRVGYGEPWYLMNKFEAIESALICVDEYINDLTKKNYYPDGHGHAFDPNFHRVQYWQQVKTHLEQMK